MESKVQMQEKTLENTVSEDKVLLEVKDIKKYYIPRGNRKEKRAVKAIDGVSFRIPARTTYGLVGESGCGKTTIGKTIMGLTDATAGQILFQGENIVSCKGRDLRRMRTRMQMIFQDPFSSMDPKKTIFQIVAEPLKELGEVPKNQLRRKVAETLESCGLTEDCLDRYPHEFSGGQRQRICIARALILAPDFIVCDEPVSALDVSVQAQVINLLKQLQREKGMAYLFISHDLSVVEHVSDHVGVMYLGKLVETAPKKLLFSNPKHPYTQALLSAVPVPELHREEQRIVLSGDVPSADNPPEGCPFHTRCWKCQDICKREAPGPKMLAGGQVVCCHLAE